MLPVIRQTLAILRQIRLQSPKRTIMKTMRGKSFLRVTLVGLGLIFSLWAHAESAKGVTAECTVLASTDLAGIEDAPTQVVAAKMVDANHLVPAYCQVQGYVAPQVGFELRLPVSDWNGKFMEVGCGGWCGSIYAEQCNGPLQHGYACVATDMGHKVRASMCCGRITTYRRKLISGTDPPT